MQAFQQLEAVIFDWAGTVVDFGSFAPTQVLIEVFAAAGVEVSLAEAREPMGLAKWMHIRTLGRLPEVAKRWHARYGREMTDADVDQLYSQFMPLQIKRVAAYSQPIPGAFETVDQLRARGLKIGSCTGYPREVMDRLLPAAAAAGFSPNHTVAADDLPAGGRPGPWMALASVIALAIGDVRHCVKVDDTLPGIEEGARAGMWTVGVSVSGNLTGLTLEEWQALPPAVRAERQDKAAAQLRAAGAHYVVETIAELPAILEQIDVRLARGERP
ncbi:phosphonoacetaldehyde hydrolase [Rhodobacteraceae bacterium CH30]|nr:phosphonoacetaldehyde hydrolase [Rhodobacteraceae bacterium CH30]